MRRHLLLIGLLGLNVILAVGWVITGTRHSGQPQVQAEDVPGQTRIKTNVLVRRQFFSWQEVESTDYPTYIANLRSIGCPEPTIRDIIVAEVNQLYAKRFLQRVPAADQRWWSNNGSDQTETIRRLRVELENERRALLTRLLGTNWETPASLAAATKRPADRLALEGPVLGTLSPETKQAVRDLVNQAEADARKQGLGPGTPAAVVQSEKALWTKLAGVLSPQQLEEFRLRYSPNAAALRRELDSLRLFNVTPEEFRGLFRATDEIDNQLRALGNGNDPATQERIQNLEQQREAVIKTSLGAKRFAEFEHLHDPDYQVALARSQSLGAPGHTVQALYQIGQAAEDEKAIVRINPNLTDAQKEIELKKIELEQAKAQAQALGENVPPDPTPPAPPPKSLSAIAHKIGSSETLSSLSKLYGVSPQVLQDANPNLNLNKLKAGDTINIPYGAPPPQ